LSMHCSVGANLANSPSRSTVKFIPIHTFIGVLHIILLSRIFYPLFNFFLNRPNKV
jgi:hypothetical protein